MTVEYFNTFVNICAEHSWNIHTDSGVNVDFDDFEEIRKDGYPYESRDFADYISTVFESLHNEDAKIMNNSCLLYTSPSPRDGLLSRMPSSA